MSGLVEVNGTRLYVDERGDRDAPALLYVHGGPGNPCWDFMASVGDLLAKRLRVIGVDQRGVLRSDALPEGAPLSVALLVEDFEAVRAALGVERWAVLGHSAGGGYALDYALAHPDCLTAALFDCPCWDADRADRHRLPQVALELDEAGKPEAAAACRRLAQKPGRLTAEDGTHLAMRELGEDHLAFFFHDEAGLAAYQRLMAPAEELDLDWERGDVHLSLRADLYRDRLPDLERLAVPTLLMRGSADLVTAPDVLEAYRAAGVGEMHTFAASAHFPFVEEPVAYAEVVADFVESVVVA